MLIIPVEQKLDGSNPPVATLLLILINCFVFFGYQAQDDQIWQTAVAYYESEGLYEYEKNVYLEYLLKNDRDQYGQFKQYEKDQAASQVMSDPGFARYLEQQYFVKNVTALKWMDARQQLDKQIADISSIKYGFTPADFSVVTLFTSMFLHGGIDHLLGNMLFLFIYGFSLEIALGRLWFIGIYLLSGVCGDLLTWSISTDSLVPNIGASGAIFGLLGMYLGLYGLRKIKFFFTAGFYVNYFKAPALVLLPYWGLFELYDQFTTRDNIAHYVHLGGLVSGALFVALAKNRFIKINREYVDTANTVDPFKEKYNRFMRHVENLNMFQAKKLLAELLQSNPNSFQLWKHQYELWKLKPNSVQYDQAAKAIFSQADLGVENAELFNRLLDEYEHVSPTQAAFNPEIRSNIFEVVMRSDRLQAAERHLIRLLDEPAMQKKLPSMLLRLAIRLSARNHHVKAKQYKEIIIHRFPDSDEAQQARIIA